MNKRIKELAEEAGFPVYDKHYAYIEGECIEKFAKLIAADEREACAKLCEQRAISGEHYVEGGAESQGCAEAIREREVDNERTN
jgi:hypothetical protein